MLDRLMQGRPLAETIVRVAPLEVVPRASTNVLFQDDHLVAEALRYLRDHANERIGVAEIAEAIAVNRRDLERRFKAAIGQTVHKYLQRLRIEHVKKQLTHTRKTLAQIRRDTPFQSASHLNQVFRRIEGMTPTQYRRRAAGPHGA
jgi:LacI family transcriptional regulator